MGHSGIGFGLVLKENCTDVCVLGGSLMHALAIKQGVRKSCLVGGCYYKWVLDLRL